MSAPSRRTARGSCQADAPEAASRWQQEALDGHGPGTTVLGTLEPRLSARSRRTVAMASEVVCGLIFRLLLPICLTVGECGPLAMVTWKGEEGAQGWGRALRNPKLRVLVIKDSVREARAVVPGPAASDSHCPECKSPGLPTFCPGA